MPYDKRSEPNGKNSSMKLNRSTIPQALLEAPDLTEAQLATVKNIQTAMLKALVALPSDAQLVDLSLLLSELLVFGVKAAVNNVKFDPTVE